VTEAIFCLDAGVWIKFLVAEEPVELSDAAARLVLRALTTGRLVCPAFAWAEVGSVLRKKVRQELLTTEQARELWTRFGELPVEYVDVPAMRARAWQLAQRHALPTLYDAGFLACTELAPESDSAVREFWTADQTLLNSLGSNRPAYVRDLRVEAGP
jgi:predicted nucleic acid-binding protein